MWGCAVWGYNFCMSGFRQKRDQSTFTGDQLASTLHALGVNFIMDGADNDHSLLESPANLIKALAQSDESRLRLALIPLFLEHPEYAALVQKVVKRLDPAAQLTLKCYYSAAVWLAKKHQAKTSLPDHFSKALNLTPVDDPEENLRMLAERHKELSGSLTNWLGTYQHAARFWQKNIELKNS